MFEANGVIDEHSDTRNVDLTIIWIVAPVSVKVGLKVELFSLVCNREVYGPAQLVRF